MAYIIKLLIRAICKPKKFLQAIELCNSCCFDDIDVDTIVSMWEARAELWSRNYTGQSEFTLDILNMFRDKKNKTRNMLLANWPVCDTCLPIALGVSHKRYSAWKRAWVDSGYTLRRVETKHKSRMRKAPIKEVFTGYLTLLSMVNFFCFLSISS